MVDYSLSHIGMDNSLLYRDEGYSELRKGED